MLHWRRSFLEENRVAFHQCQRDLLPGTLENSADRRSGDIHAPRCLFLVDIFEIRQMQRLQLVERHRHLPEFGEGKVCRVENRDPGYMPDTTRFVRPGHRRIVLLDLFCNDHVFITKNRQELSKTPRKRR